jgi:signal transduction histidine kinase
LRRLAVIFILAVLTPTLVLAWLAIRSLRDQQIISERQRTLLYQGICSGLVKDIIDFMGERETDFGRQVEALIAAKGALPLARDFDEQILKSWPLAEVGFAVTQDGQVLSPPLLGRQEARRFRLENDLFQSNQQSIEVYWRSPKGDIPLSKFDDKPAAKRDGEPLLKTDASRKAPSKEALDGKTSRLSSEEAEFRHLIGEATTGTLARFLQNKLKLLMWYRSPGNPGIVFGTELKLENLEDALRPLVQIEEPFRADVCVALLDDNGQPIARSRPDFATSWKHPFVSAEVGELLPHWEVAAYLVDPARLTQSAQTLALTLGLLVCALLLAIGSGSWLIVADLRRQLFLARQKTDFVSNVSHELKTPLTSIRMFSELLAEGRVTEPDKQRTYLAVIANESARLTRLINNVLDFAKLERGQKKYDLQPCELDRIAREVADTYRPHLEAGGFRFECRLPDRPVPVLGDRDALAQVIVNLLSNAEKYSGEQKEISLDLPAATTEMNRVELRVLDRGLGVPQGCEEKIFEQFYRAHDSLSSGIPGSGLGLTLARQIARAHGGDIRYAPRPGGGSWFTFELPVA